MKIHEMAALVAFGNAEQAQQGALKLKQFVEAGGDVNTLEEGMTALSVVLSAERPKAKQTSSKGPQSTAIENSIKLLVDAGANPWAGAPCAWELDTLWSPVELLGYRRACGHTLCGPDGSTDLHALLKRDDHILSRLLPNLVVDYVHPDWLDALDDAGRTPLHVLWGRELTHNEGEEERFEITTHLIDQGARLDIPGPDGVCVASLISSNQALREAVDGDRFAVRALREIDAIAQAVALKQSADQIEIGAGDRVDRRLRL